MIIRTITEKDFSAVDFLMCQLHKIHSEARPDIYLPAQQVYSEEEFAEKLKDENSFLIAAEEENKIAGICFFKIRESVENKILKKRRTALIEDIFVAEEFRRKGIAKMLFEQAEKTAKEKGAESLELLVWDFNRGAMEFYEAEGMIPQRHFLEKKL